MLNVHGTSSIAAFAPDPNLHYSHRHLSALRRSDLRRVEMFSTCGSPNVSMRTHLQSDTANGSATPPAPAARSAKQRVAKSAVSDEELEAQYSKMAETFLQTGLDIDVVKTARKYFGGSENTRCGPTAQLYSELEDGGLPPNAVRLIVLPVADAPQISSFGAPHASLSLALRNMAGWAPMPAFLMRADAAAMHALRMCRSLGVLHLRCAMALTPRTCGFRRRCTLL